MKMAQSRDLKTRSLVSCTVLKRSLLVYFALSCALDTIDYVAQLQEISLNHQRCKGWSPQLSSLNGDYQQQQASDCINDTLQGYDSAKQMESKDSSYFAQLKQFADSRLWQLRFEQLRPLMMTIKQAHAIKIVGLEAPNSIQSGQPLRLKCLYELRGDKLQSLSWYKNGREFYRYQPFERRQPMLAFNLTGVSIDVTRSRNNTVTLVNTSADTSGRYKCEATGTTFQESNFEIYVNVVNASSGATPLVVLNTYLLYCCISIPLMLSFRRL